MEAQNHLLEIGPCELFKHIRGDKGGGGTHGEDCDTVSAGALYAGDAGLDNFGGGFFAGGLDFFGAVIEVAAEFSHSAGH